MRFRKARTFVATLACSLLVASYALSQDKKRVTVLEFEGPSAGQVRGHVVSALSKESDVELVPESEVKEQAQGSLSSESDYQELAQKLSLSAFVEGKVTGKGKNLTAVITVRNGTTGEVVHEETWRRKSKAELKAIRTNFWEVMGPHILASEAPAPIAKDAVADEPIPALQQEAPEQAEARSEEEPEKESAPSGRTAFVGTFGPRLMWRTLAYDGDALGNLRPYTNAGGSPGVNAALTARWFPGAHKSDGFLGDIGLDFSFDYTIGLKSKEDGRSRSTLSYDLGLGLVYRLNLDMFEPRFLVGYVRQVFDVKTASTTFFPAVNYSSVRFGLGCAIAIVERVGLDVSFAYLYSLSADELTSKAYFPDASGFGFEAGAALNVGVAGPFGLRLGVDFRRYAFDLNPPSMPQPGGAKIADSATDDYLRANLSGVLTF